MIVYLASYPRSGNSLIQQVIHAYLQRPITTVYPGSIKPVQYASGAFDFINTWENPQANLYDKIIGQVSLSHRFKAHLAKYQLEAFPSKIFTYLMPGCKHLLTPQNRAYLAQLPSVFFIKTHELPFSSYFEKEYVLFPFRHPGAVVWSYYHYLKKDQKPGYSVAEVIKGNIPFGSWPEYIDQWLKASKGLGNRFLPLQFENTLNNPEEAARKIGELTGIPLHKNGRMPAFQELHQQAP